MYYGWYKVMNDDMVIQKFHDALEEMKIAYDKETGRLSDAIYFVVYEARRKIEAKRVFVFKDYFLIIEEDKNDTRKVHFKNVKGFQSPNRIIEL